MVTLLSLPTEIISDALSYLSYGDLKKRAPLVCHKFHSLITNKPNPLSATEIDKKLWRDAPKPSSFKTAPETQTATESNKKPPPPPQFDLHPLLGYHVRSPYSLSYHFTSDINEVRVVKSSRSRRNYYYDSSSSSDDGKGESDDRLLFSPLGQENACCPSVSQAEYHRVRFNGKTPGKGVIIEGSGDGGRVTVLDVMKGICSAVEGNKWSGGSWGYCWDGVEGSEVLDGVLHLYDMPH